MASNSKNIAELLNSSNLITNDKIADATVTVAKLANPLNLSSLDVTLPQGVGQTNWSNNVKTSSFTAVSSNGYFVDTVSGPIVVTLPASPSIGSIVSLVDISGSADVNRIIINPNGEKLNSQTLELDIDVESGGVQLTFSGNTFGWIATESVNNVKETNRTGKILVESYPVIVGIENSFAGQYFQQDGDVLTITGKNFKSGLTVTYTSNDNVTNYDDNSATVSLDGSTITSTIPAGMAPSSSSSGGDPFDVIVTNPTSLDNPSIPLASNSLSNVLEWLPSPTFNVSTGNIGFIYYDDVNLSNLSATLLNAVSLDTNDIIVSYAISSGSLPQGMSLNTSTGEITGIPDSIVFNTSGSVTHTFTITATAESGEGVNTETTTNSSVYSINTRSTKVSSISPTDYNGTAGSTIVVTGIGFSGTGNNAIDSMTLIFPDSSTTNLTKNVDFVIDSDTQITITTPNSITINQAGAGIDIAVTDVNGYVYKLSENPSYTLLTTGSAPTMGTPGTLTIQALDRGTSWTGQIPIASDSDGSIVSYSATFVSSDNTIDVTGFSINNSGLISASIPIGYWNAGGTITATVTATDNAGNTGTEDYVITVDPSYYSSGGTVTTSGGYQYHTFTSDGTFSIAGTKTIDYLFIGGGGGGGGQIGGGGGAGGRVVGTTSSFPAGTYNIVIGGGGGGGYVLPGGGPQPTSLGGNGGNTTITNSSTSTVFATAYGGGGGGGQTTGYGSSGGCGGGATNAGLSIGFNYASGGTGSQGGNGGDGHPTINSAGGGGGHGGNGDGSASYGNGGLGTTWVDGVSRGGGGGGHNGDGNSPIYGGGSSGGGSGGFNGTAGTANTGGGGGGSLGGSGGSGGSGIVIFRITL